MPEESPDPSKLTPEQAATLASKTIENIVNKIAAGGIPSARESKMLADATDQRTNRVETPKAAKAKRKPGRPNGATLCTPEVVKELCSRLAKGESLLHICKFESSGDERQKDDFYQHRFPSYRQIEQWRCDNATFAAQFARAREVGFDALADECIEIADKCEEDPASRRVKVDTRLKLLACWAPHRYGARLALEGKVETTAPVMVIELAGIPPAGDRKPAFEPSRE